MAKPLSQMTCWALSAGHAGMENQCVGLAEALGVTPIRLRTQDKGKLWKFLPPALWPDPLGLREGGGRFEPPWPDILISCGRRSVATAMAIRKKSGGKTFTVNIQEPHAPLQNFDLVIVPRHDKLRGANVHVMRGAIHLLTRGKLTQAAERWRPVFASLPRPLIAVLVGGPNRRQVMTPETIRDLVTKLKNTAALSGAGVAATPSRRTGAENEAALRTALSGPGCWVWGGTGDNPYLGLLALADALVVTADSVSMLSEAAFTGKPVYVYEVPGRGSRRLAQFRAGLAADGITRPFTGGALADWSYQPLDETAEIAALIRAKLAQI